MEVRIPIAFVAGILFAVSCGNPIALAELWIDPEQSITWDELLACELVIVGTYDAHQGGDLTLKVSDVLKGNADRDKLLTIKLEHLYTLETGHVGWDTWIKKETPPDGIPKLCYKAQSNNPGGLALLPLLSDAREPAIYFFPKASAPALKRRRQVQPASQRQGWQEALDTKRPNLFFRLTQNANRDLARDALEELGKTRNAACLDQLFARVLNPVNEPGGNFDAYTALSRLGDQGGDVYDRAARLLASAAPGTNEYRFFPLATIMAISDEPRAWNDLPKLIADGTQPLRVRQAALNALKRIRTRSAAQFVLDYLPHPEFAEAAVHSLLALLDGNTDQFPKSRGLDDREWLVQQVRLVKDDERTPASVRTSIASWFRPILEKREAPDLARLRQRLLDRSDRTYHGWADGETADMLRQARNACDPRVIPILVEVLEKLPEASGNRGYAFQETLKFYATICPRQTAQELKKRGLPDRLAAIPRHERSFLISDALEGANLWPSRFHSPATDELERCHTLARQVREGAADENELIAATERFVAKNEMNGLACQAIGALLEAGTPAARERFFTHVNEAKRVRFNEFSEEPVIYSTLADLLHHLFPGDTAAYGEQVLGLLRSNSLAERRAGKSSLDRTVGCGFDFDPEALAAERLRRLHEIEPWLRRLIGKTELEARVLLLSRAGVELTGQPNDSWLKPLIAVAQSNDLDAVHQALRLIEIVIAERRASQFGGWPQEQRSLGLRAYLQDAGKLELSGTGN